MMTVTDMPTPLQSRRTGGSLYFDTPYTHQVLQAWREWAYQVPDSVTTSAAVLRGDAVPEALRGRTIIEIRIDAEGTGESAEALISPMRRVGRATLDTIGVGTVSASSDAPADRTVPLGELDPAAIEALVAAARDSGALDRIQIHRAPAETRRRGIDFVLRITENEAGQRESSPSAADSVASALKKWAATGSATETGSISRFVAA